MKKKNLFFLIMIVCVGLLIPKDTFALQVYNNVNIDYRFFVDEDDSDEGNLKFKLYDKTGTLNFESKYDPSTKHYYFEYNDINYDKRWNYVGVYGWSWVPFGWDSANYDSYDSNILSYYPSQFTEIFNSDYRNENFFETFLQKNSYAGTFSNYYDQGTTIVCYTFIPLILESVDTGSKKILFANTSIRNQFGLFTQLFFVNNTTKIKNEPVMIGDSFLENVDFMRKTILDYSDELWEELNNGPIASSEIYSDNKASANYKYVNQSIGTGEQNVPEETLDDYANSLPVLSFKKENTSDNNVIVEDNNISIVDAMTNPKTWNNGVVILVVSIILVIGSSILLIRKIKV